MTGEFKRKLNSAKTDGDFEGIKGPKDEFGKDFKGVVCFSAIP